MWRPFVIGAAVLALQAPVPAPAITGVRVSVVPKTTAALKATIENRRHSPLVRIDLGLTRRGQSAPFETFSRYFREPSGPEGRDSSPLPPNARRVLDLVLRNGSDIETLAVILAVFEDGLAEGTPAALAAWRKTRDERREDLKYWAQALEAMPRISEPALREFLAARISERGREAAEDRSTVRSSLQRLLHQNPSGPEVWLPLDRLLATVRRELAAIPPEPPRTGEVTAGGSVPGVVLSWERSAATERVAVIENLRNIPIEAFGLEHVDPVSGLPVGGQRSDFCLGEPVHDTTGGGRIQPKEVREVHLSGAAGHEVRLSFVLFDDLSFEGRADERDQLLRAREATAADYAAAIDVITRASALPPGEAHAFVKAQRAERAVRRRPDGRAHDVSVIDEFIRQLTESPDRAVAGAKGFLDHIERQRQRLIRHLRR
jgi:hypothetical protein